MELANQKHVLRGVRLYKPVITRDKHTVISIYLTREIKHLIRVLEANLGSTIPVHYDINTQEEYADIIAYKPIESLSTSLTRDMVYDITIKIKSANIGANILWRIISIEMNLDSLKIIDDDKQDQYQDIDNNIDEDEVSTDIRDHYITVIHELYSQIADKSRKLAELKDKLETDTYMILNSFNIDDCKKYDKLLSKYERLINKN